VLLKIRIQGYVLHHWMRLSRSAASETVPVLLTLSVEGVAVTVDYEIVSMITICGTGTTDK
jgi:hypothetical protein